ncbi:MAG: hypothetical protein NT067_02950, partial [Candidatus Diapherotrites archaeon]|nr:hypothetical protein [Candidatus Diapherotrites archaeon]
MRAVFLFFIALAAAAFIGAFVLIEALDLTVLNSGYIKGKIAEQKVYEKIIASSSDGSESMGAKDFVEIVGPESVKTLGDSFVDGTLAFLRNPAVKEIEVGMPDAIFSPKTSFSLDQVFGAEIISALGQAKVAVQTLLVAKSMSLLLALVFLVIIVLIARGISSKLKWAGFSLMAAGILAWLFSALASGLMSSFVEKNFAAGFPPALGQFLASVLADYASLAAISGLILLLCGALLIVLSFSFFSGY